MEEQPYPQSPWDLDAPRFFDCRRPHSFYDFVEWCTQDTHAAWPVSRMCNIMRKRQQRRSEGGQDHPLSAVVEPLADSTPGSSIDDKLLRDLLEKEITSQLLRVSFFLDRVEKAEDIRPGLQQAYQGYFILKRITPIGGSPFGHVFEAIIDASEPILNNYVHAQSDFQQEVCGCSFRSTGSYFCQQNGVSTVCAHDALLSALMSMANGPPEAQIRECLHRALRVPDGQPGPQLRQMVRALNELGVACTAQDLETAPTLEDYRGLVYATIESGFPAVIGFTTANERHAITVVGHTFNSDSWMPEVEFGYGASADTARYHTSYDWIPHWIVNDGNLGMYYCLEANRMRLTPSGPHVPDGPVPFPEPLKAVAVIGLYEEDADIVVRNAEEKVSLLLGELTDVLARTDAAAQHDPQSKWLKRLLRSGRDDVSPGPILRTLQITKDQYVSHLVNEPDWNNSTLAPEQRKTITARLLPLLPPRVWMTEFTLVNLFTANRRKLGEVIYKSSWSRSAQVLGSDLLFVRLPGIAWFPTEAHVDQTAVTSHTRIARCLATSASQPEY